MITQLGWLTHHSFFCTEYSALELEQTAEETNQLFCDCAAFKPMVHPDFETASKLDSIWETGLKVLPKVECQRLDVRYLAS